MRIQLVSDIHLEFAYSTCNIPHKDSDLLVLAGDICTAKELIRSPDKYINFFTDVSSKFPDIIYLLGNHEHYHYDIQNTYNDIKAALARFPNIHVLEQESIVINNTPIWAGTLWTDCDKENLESIRQLKYGMNDYRIIKNNGKTLHPTDTIQIHKESLVSLNTFLDTYKNAPVVVLAHHAPSLKSIHPQYKNDPLNGGFASNIEYIINQNPNIKFWGHGHTHTSFDYVINKTRVVCNPAGYPNWHGDRENPTFDVGLVIDV